jgi:hypothetical protein
MPTPLHLKRKINAVHNTGLLSEMYNFFLITAYTMETMRGTEK